MYFERWCHSLAQALPAVHRSHRHAYLPTCCIPKQRLKTEKRINIERSLTNRSKVFKTLPLKRVVWGVYA